MRFIVDTQWDIYIMINAQVQLCTRVYIGWEVVSHLCTWVHIWREFVAQLCTLMWIDAPRCTWGQVKFYMGAPKYDYLL